MSVTTFPLDTLSGLELFNAAASAVTYRGRRAVRLIEGEATDNNTHSIAILTGSDFRSGIIETEIASIRRPDAHPDMRGFAGICFRVQPAGRQFECFFLRPDNGRADDQLRRNHSTQYISHPDWPWYRLREEHPGVYESYTDLVSGAWTSVKIAVSGTRAELFVGGAQQPCLIVKDLKLGDTHGSIALWIGRGTEAHFSAITVK